jgi:DNA modification methylase
MNIDLYNGNCLEVMDKLITDGIMVDAIITDPPYNIARENNFHTMGRAGIDFGKWDKGFDLFSYIDRAYKLLNKNGSIVIPGDISFDTGFISVTLNVSSLSSPTKVNLQSESYRNTNVIGNYLSDGTNLAQISFADSVDVTQVHEDKHNFV